MIINVYIHLLDLELVDRLAKVLDSIKQSNKNKQKTSFNTSITKTKQNKTKQNKAITHTSVGEGVGFSVGDGVGFCRLSLYYIAIYKNNN